MISVIIPIYNAEKTIGTLLDCFLAQTSQEYELILVNDCSTDGTVDRIKTYAHKFKHLELYSTPRNMKQGGARNLGISKATRPYLAFVDPDDVIVDEFIAKISEQIEQCAPDLIAFDYYEVKNNQKIYKKNDKVEGTFLDKKKLLARKYGWELWQQVYKKTLFSEHELLFSEDLYVTDLEIGALLYLYATHVVKVDEALYYYIRHEEATTAFKRNDPKVHHLVTINELRVQHFKNRGFYNDYKEEIDAVFFWHIAIISMFRAYYNFDRINVEMIKRLEQLLARHVPTINENKYVRNEKRVVKLFYSMSQQTKGLLGILLFVLKRVPHSYMDHLKSRRVNKNNW